MRKLLPPPKRINDFMSPPTLSSTGTKRQTQNLRWQHSPFPCCRAPPGIHWHAFGCWICPGQSMRVIPQNQNRKKMGIKSTAQSPHLDIFLRARQTYHRRSFSAYSDIPCTRVDSRSPSFRSVGSTSQHNLSGSLSYDSLQQGFPPPAACVVVVHLVASIGKQINDRYLLIAAATASCHDFVQGSSYKRSATPLLPLKVQEMFEALHEMEGLI